MIVVALSLTHAGLALRSFGGPSGLLSPNPIAVHDHVIQEHNAWVTRSMLMRTGLASGYDPFFMSGYAKSLLSSPSSTLFEVVAFATGGRSPAVTYKVTVFLALAALPWLIAWAGAILRLGGMAVASGVAFFLVYVWTSGGGGGFPLNYATVGMTAYLLCVPLGLVAVAAIVRYLRRGGGIRFTGATLLLSLSFLVHVTSVLVIAPAIIAACLGTAKGDRGRVSRSLMALWVMPILAVALNAFWVLPASWLRTTRAEGAAFMTNSNARDPVWSRLAKIATEGPPIQAVTLGLGLLGLVALWRRDRVAAAALAGFAGSGLALGYIAGFTSMLDFLQPGRQTHALYSAAAVLSGIGLAQVAGSITLLRSRMLTVAAIAASALMAGRCFGPQLARTITPRLGLSADVGWRPFLTSEPRPSFLAIVEALREITEPGDRVFYEEYGITVDGETDPFAGGRFSGLLPRILGVEVVGGPYLHVGVDTNFSQIGEGKFFGEKGWNRESFDRYAAIYRPSAIVCFSAPARGFCLANPDLVTVIYNRDRILVGKVVGFGGATIRGHASVAAEPGRLRVSGMSPGLDGLVVLRYHVVPGLRCQPSMPIVAVRQADDPVPFIGLKPGPGQTETVLDIGFPPGR